MRFATEPCQLPKPPRPEFENVDPLTAGYSMLLASSCISTAWSMARLFGQRGMQHGEVFALTLLSRNEGMSQRELTAILHLSPPTGEHDPATRSKERSGGARADDRPAPYSDLLTPEGRRREKEQRAVLGSYVDRTIGALSEADRLDLARLLDELADRTQEVLREERRQRRRGRSRSDEAAAGHLSQAVLEVDLGDRRPAAGAGHRQPLSAHPQRQHHQQRRAKGDTGYIGTMGGYMLLVAVLQTACAIASAYLAAKAAMAFGRDVRSALFRKVESFSQGEINRFGTPSLITRNTNDVQQVQMMVALGLSLMIFAPMMGIGGIIMALRQDARLSLTLVVILPVMVLVFVD